MEAAAAARRRLPPGGMVPPDRVFPGQGPGAAPMPVRRSELLAPGKNPLVIYSMMFRRAADDTSPGPRGGPAALLSLAEGPRPSCTALLVSWTATVKRRIDTRSVTTASSTVVI